jgi:hypothetical protein
MNVCLRRVHAASYNASDSRICPDKIDCFASTVGNTSYLTTSTLNTKYIWAVLIKLHDSHRATYDDDLLQVTDKLYHIEITLILLPIKNSQATVDEK